MKDLEVSRGVQEYINHIAAYDREFAKWESRTTKILNRYREDGRNVQDASSKFNILWSNVQTLKAATFARLPKPDVSRRFRDNDQVGRVASLILERALDYEISHYTDYRETLVSAMYDRFLGGRGVAWVRYEPHFIAEEQGLPEDGLQVTEDTDEAPEPDESVEYECAPCDYVHWRDFGHGLARTWEEVSIVWRRVYLSKEQMIERFGEELAKKIPLDATPSELKNATKENVSKQALIYEIWDKNKGKAYWLSKSLGEFCDERDDPLDLEGFWPCPKPLYATLTNDSLVPTPDFALYQDQANQLDVLSQRIEGLIRALQVRGVYDAATPEISRLFTEGMNTTLIPVTNWSAFAEKNGLKGAISLVDITPIAQALGMAYQAFEQVKAQIYDITGISDIVRGQSVASETATAQQIKGQYASLRLKAYQEDVVRFATHMLQLKAQIICGHFDDETILKMAAADQFNDADKPLIPEAMALLRDEPMRSFRVEISSDSMTSMDDQQEKQDRMEFLSATSQFIERAVAATNQAPQIAPLVLDLLKFGVQGFKIGKGLEGEIEQTIRTVKDDLKQRQQQPPKPDPEQLKQQAEMQKEQAKQQAETQRRGMELQQEAQAAQFAAQLQMQADERKMEHEAQLQAQQTNMELMFERWKTQFQGEIELLKAEISANATLTAQQDAAVQGALQ